MITYVVGNLFESPARVLVNTVNTVGVMGKGIAKDFKSIYPEMFKKYVQLCESKELTIGKLWLYKTPNKWILNFPTKGTWRQPSKVEYVEAGLQAFVRGYAERSITSVAFPQLGCGNGELDWERQVHPLMEKYLGKLPIDIFVHLYRRNQPVPEHRDVASIAVWLRSEPEVLGFSEVWHDLEQLIGRGLPLETLTDKKPFHVQMVCEEEPGLCFSAGTKSRFLPQEDLAEFWGLIRSYGFSLARAMPPKLEPFTPELVALFAKLPYCRPVHVSTEYKALGAPKSLGLQWFPLSGGAAVPRKPPVEVRAA